jgi:hypothetical protein
MTCPVCRSYVSVHSFFEATGLSGVSCPHCKSSLWPSRLSHFILMMVVFLPSYMLLRYLGSLHANFFVSIAVFAVVAVGGYTLLAPWIIRLQPKESSILGLTHR